jgi:hypothetical protein
VPEGVSRARAVRDDRQRLDSGRSRDRGGRRRSGRPRGTVDKGKRANGVHCVERTRRGRSEVL